MRHAYSETRRYNNSACPEAARKEVQEGKITDTCHSTLHCTHDFNDWGRVKISKFLRRIVVSKTWLTDCMISSQCRVTEPLSAFAFYILLLLPRRTTCRTPRSTLFQTLTGENIGFRKHRRMDEHLLTATLFLDKAWDKGIPVWIVSLDLSKAFDRANWNALWLALHDHGISDHLVWILQLIYANQLGEVQGEHSNSDPFPIHAGVRQGCVLSPRLFCSVLQWGMSAWRRNAETKRCGFDLGDNMPPLLDLRFADDILLFARTAAEAMALLDDLICKLQNIGLQLNAAKTVVLTSEVRPPSSLHTNNGVKLRVLKQEEAHKWLGCVISAAGSRNTHLDLQHHLQAASRAFHANKWILCDKGVSILHRLRYFEKVISPVACFGASHRAIHKDDLAKLDVEYRRLMRKVVGPPTDTNWASPWHEILHGWNNKVQMLSDHAGLKPWSVTCIEAVWKFASYVAVLPPERWTRRILEWNMRGPRKRGRPAYTWETALQKYSIWKGFNNWIVEAAGREHWMLMKRDFVFFTLHNRWSKILNSICLRPKGAAFGPASFDFDFDFSPALLKQKIVLPTRIDGKHHPLQQWYRQLLFSVNNVYHSSQVVTWRHGGHGRRACTAN